MQRGRWGPRARASAPAGSGPGTRASRRRASRRSPGFLRRRSCRRHRRRPWSAPERLAQLLPELLSGVFVAGRRALHFGELLQQRALLRRQLGGRPHVHAHVEIAAPALAHARQPLATQPVHGAGLRAGLQLQRRRPVRSGHAQLRAQRRLREGQRQIVDEVVTLTLEARVLGDVEHGDQVTGRTVARPRGAGPAHREVVMIGDPRGDVDLHQLLRANPAVPLALRAGLRDDAPIPGTRGTGRHRYELPEHGACGPLHLARATARAAGRRARARRGAAAAAFGAPLVGAHLDLLGGAARHLGEIELEGHLHVLAAVLLLPAAPAPEQRIEAAQPAEVAHEHVERFGQVEVREPEVTAARSASAAQTGGAIAIVGGALLRIPQDLVGLGDLLELRLGRLLFVRTYAIGMMLHREATVGLFDLGFVRVARDAEQRVVVVRHSSSSPTRRLVWSTRATILSYGMRVGPMTPMTPASAPSRYEAVTSVKGASLGS